MEERIGEHDRDEAENWTTKRRNKELQAYYQRNREDEIDIKEGRRGVY